MEPPTRVPAVLVCVLALAFAACGEPNRSVDATTDGGSRETSDASYTGDGGPSQVQDGATPHTPADAGDASALSELSDAGTHNQPDASSSSLDCGRIMCPSHASCRVQSGEASCICDTGYQDNDRDGSCEGWIWTNRIQELGPLMAGPHPM